MTNPDDDIVEINRAPVLTLWAAVVAEALGFDSDEALTLGKAVAGLTAQAKGRRLGIFEPTPENLRAARARHREEIGAFPIGFMGRKVPVLATADGLRALDRDRPAEPRKVERYLAGKFGSDLDAVRDAMRALAASRDGETLMHEAFDLYLQFRPEVPPGEKGWGAKGRLSLPLIRELANQPTGAAHRHREGT